MTQRPRPNGIQAASEALHAKYKETGFDDLLAERPRDRTAGCQPARAAEGDPGGVHGEHRNEPSES